MAKNILWLDNDEKFNETNISVLKDAGYSVTLLGSVSEAEVAIMDSNNGFDLLLLDVMIPTRAEEEKQVYLPTITEKGKQTGLILYQRVRDELVKRKIPIIVISQRLDARLPQKFFEAGLPQQDFYNRFSLYDPDEFLRVVQEALSRNR